MRRPQAAGLAEFGEVLQPHEAMEPILARPVRDALLEWLVEIWAEDELTAIGVKPRRRAIFSGPPGVGKTTLAHHLAGRLGLLMVAVRPERLIDSWVGSTGRNIGSLFDAAAAEDPPVILFLDEIDAIASKRHQARQGAEQERNAFVNTLLQRIEAHTGFLIAATNHADQIDPAIWRRFHIHVTLELPGQSERERIIARYLAPYGLPASSLRMLAESLETASPALIRELIEGLKRQIVIGPKIGSPMGHDRVFGRLLAALQPHPDLGKPRLWSLGKSDPALAALPWPLPMATDLPSEEAAEDAPSIVLPMRRR